MTRLWIVCAGKQGDRELAAVEQGGCCQAFSKWATCGASPTVTPFWSILLR